MKVYLYCVHSTFVGVVLANNKDEAKSKVSEHYINSSDIKVVNPLDRDIMIDDRYEIGDLFNYSSLEEQKLKGENLKIKDTLEHISKLINNICE